MLERQAENIKLGKIETTKVQSVKELRAGSKIFYGSKAHKAKCKRSILQMVKNIKSHTLKSQMFNKPNSNSQKVSRSKWIKAKC